MRRRSSVLAAAALVALSGLAEAAEPRLKRILDTGVPRVGTTGDRNPMTIRDPATDSYKGYDIDMLTEMAADPGVEVEFVATDWKTIVQGIQADKHDIPVRPRRARRAPRWRASPIPVSSSRPCPRP